MYIHTATLASLGSNSTNCNRSRATMTTLKRRAPPTTPKSTLANGSKPETTPKRARLHSRRGPEAPWIQPEHKRPFTQLDSATIKRLYHFYDTDPNLQSVSRICLESVLGGGIHLSRAGHTLDQAASRWYNQEWSQWMKDVMRSVWSIGFALCVPEPHPRYVSRPRVLDLSRLEVEYHLDIAGTPTFRVHDPEMIMSKTSADYAAQLMPSSITPLRGSKQEWLTRAHHQYIRALDGFLPSTVMADSMIQPSLTRPEDHNTPLSNDRSGHRPNRIYNIVPIWEHLPQPVTGELRSRLSLLWPDKCYADYLLRCTIEAQGTRSKLIMVTEDSTREDNHGQSSPGEHSTPSDLAEKVICDSLKNKQKALNRVDLVSKLMQSREFGILKEAVSEQLGHSGVPNVQTWLPKDRKLVRHTPAEVPTTLLDHRAAVMERTYAAFGVPMSMMSNRNVTGYTSMNENALFVFRNSQRYLQQFLVTNASKMYRSMFSALHIEEWIAALRPADRQLVREEVDSGRFDIQSMSKQIEAEFVLSGSPPPMTIETLYAAGVLKYDAYRSYMANAYCLPVTAFHDHQQPPPELVMQQKLNPEGPVGARGSGGGTSAAGQRGKGQGQSSA